MESTSTVIAHGVHMWTVSLLQAGTAKTQKPLVRYRIQLTSGISQIKNSEQNIFHLDGLSVPTSYQTV